MNSSILHMLCLSWSLLPWCSGHLPLPSLAKYQLLRSMNWSSVSQKKAIENQDGKTPIPQNTGTAPSPSAPPPYLHPLYFPLQPKVGRRGGIWKGIGADRFWKPRQLEKALGGSILLIYAAFHSPKCFNFTLISKIAVQISNAAWSFSCLHRAGSVFKGGPLTADLLPRVGARVGCAVARHTSATQQ